MARGRRRHSSYSNKLRALPVEAMYAAGVSIFSLLIFGVILGVSIYMSGETPKFVGGIAMLGFFTCLSAFVFNIRQMQTKTELKYRLICLGVSTFAMIVWATPYVLGLLN